MFEEFFVVVNLCSFLGQNVDKSGDFLAQRQIFVKMVIFFDFCEILSKLYFSTKTCGKRKFGWVFPKNDKKLSFCFCDFFAFAKFSTSEKANKINALRIFIYKNPMAFQQFFHIVENLLISGVSFHNFIIY